MFCLVEALLVTCTEYMTLYHITLYYSKMYVDRSERKNTLYVQNSVYQGTTEHSMSGLCGWCSRHSQANICNKAADWAVCMGPQHQVTSTFPTLCRSIWVVADPKILRKCKKMSHGGSVRKTHHSVLKAYSHLQGD